MGVNGDRDDTIVRYGAEMYQFLQSDVASGFGVKDATTFS
jgi:hypothetical protein